MSMAMGGQVAERQQKLTELTERGQA